MVHECGQMDIIDSESNQSIHTFDDQSKYEMQESKLYMYHGDHVVSKARQLSDAVTPPALTRHEIIDNIIPRINCQESRMDNLIV